MRPMVFLLMACIMGLGIAVEPLYADGGGVGFRPFAGIRARIQQRQANFANARANNIAAQANLNFVAKAAKFQNFGQHHGKFQNKNIVFVPRNNVVYYQAPAVAFPAPAVYAPSYQAAPYTFAAPTCHAHAPACTVQAPTCNVQAPAASFFAFSSVRTFSQSGGGGCYMGF